MVSLLGMSTLLPCLLSVLLCNWLLVYMILLFCKTCSLHSLLISLIATSGLYTAQVLPKQPTSWIKYGDNVLRITGVMISQGEKPLARR